MARTVIGLSALAFVGYFAYLTVEVALRDGISFPVVLSLLLILLVAVAGIGALTNRHSDD
jgi:hypothetical protein